MLMIFHLALMAGISKNDIDLSPKRLMKDIRHICQCDSIDFVDLKYDIDSVTNTIKGKYLKVVNRSTVIGYAYIGRVNMSGHSYNNSYEYFDYFILYNVRGKIMKVDIFNYEAFHGREVTARWWLDQFIGYDGNTEVVVGKNIDAISGATVSVHHITRDIVYRTNTIRNFLRE